MTRLLPCILLLSTSFALSGCGGAGQSTPPPPVVCQVAAVIFQDPMTQPPAGAVGVSTTIGSITVPQMNGVAGTVLQLTPPLGTGPTLGGGFFVSSGPSSLTAAVPKLQPNSTYHAFSVAGCSPFFDFGQFTTGAT